MIICFSHHLHRCPGYNMSPCMPPHQLHVWRCFRPKCEDAPDYLCGLIADTIQRNLDTLEKNRETMRQNAVRKRGR